MQCSLRATTAQLLVGFLHGLELFGGSWSWVHVRVELLDFCPVSRLNVLLAGISGHAEQCMGVP